MILDSELHVLPNYPFKDGGKFVFVLTRRRMAKKQSGAQEEEDEDDDGGDLLTALDLEDLAAEELAKFQTASRITGVSKSNEKLKLIQKELCVCFSVSTS